MLIFRYFKRMTEYENELYEKDGKRTMLICGPIVFKEHSPIHPSPYIWTIISKSTKSAPEAPKNSEVILSSDYSLNEVFELANSEKWRNKIRRIFVLGGVPIYNTCFQQTAIPTRYNKIYQFIR